MENSLCWLKYGSADKAMIRSAAANREANVDKPMNCLLRFCFRYGLQQSFVIVDEQRFQYYLCYFVINICDILDIFQSGLDNM